MKREEAMSLAKGPDLVKFAQDRLDPEHSPGATISRVASEYCNTAYF